MFALGTVLGGLSAVIWGWLLLARGRFWQSGPSLPEHEARHGELPSVTVVIPARDEAEHIRESVGSLLRQDYPGALRIVVVDDNSTDGTGGLAESLQGAAERLRVVRGAPLMPGWSGKMWAVSQGLAQPEARRAAFLLLTDADIVHGPRHVAHLVAKAIEEPGEPLGLVSEMVRLRTESVAERALIPAFVFFFQMLYPFAWVSDEQRDEAAAAGGTMLVERQALDRVGGVSAIRDALIDDVALATEVKRGGYRIWLGHADAAESLRRYPGFGDVFAMVSRTAYVQLRYSPVLLAGTVAGMGLVYVLPVGLALFGRGKNRALGVGSWVLMAGAFQPTLRRYKCSPLWGLALPGIAAFYLAATVGSAVLHARGRGGRWKGRVYASA